MTGMWEFRVSGRSRELCGAGDTSAPVTEPHAWTGSVGHPVLGLRAPAHLHPLPPPLPSALRPHLPGLPRETGFLF